MTVDSVFELVCGVQSYDWGKLGKNNSKVSQFAQGLPAFEYDENKPYAELWMGTHPSCPSSLLSTSQSLKELLKQQPELSGERVAKKFGADLPFLFKVLAIRKALSIQAHPDKTLAQKLHSTKPDIYKDPNHKPEMAIALTPFSGFCGFRQPKEILAFLNTVPEFNAVLGKKVVDSFSERFKNGGADSESTKAGLKELFSALMVADSSLISTQVSLLISRLQSEKNSLEKQERELIIALNDDFEGDVGIFCTFVLNIVHLKPGEAVFLKANEPHAYLDGDIMECMATSDNVVRAGLTPKLRDVPTLTSMLTYTSAPPSAQVLPPTAYKGSKFTKLYDPPIEEFSVLLTSLKAGEEETYAGIDGPSIMIFTELSGSVRLEWEGEHQEIEVRREGQVFFVGAGVEVKVGVEKGTMSVYRAFVEAGHEE